MKDFTFDEASHIYCVSGVAVPSVTQITRFCFADVDKSRPWAAQEAADRGTRVHQYCMLMDYEALPETVDADCAGYLQAYRRFLRDYSPRWDGIEESGHSSLFGLEFAGTIDRHGTLMNMPAIVDIKTGKLHDAALEAQLYGYAVLLATKHRRPCPYYNLYALKLSKDGTYQLQAVRLNPDVFSACIVLHQSTLPKSKRKRSL